MKIDFHRYNNLSSYQIVSNILYNYCQFPNVIFTSSLGAYQPSNELLLRFYSYYKQATEGPCHNHKPPFWEIVRRAKWTAWTQLGNMSRYEAMENYVEELKKVRPRFKIEFHF